MSAGSAIDLRVSVNEDSIRESVAKIAGKLKAAEKNLKVEAEVSVKDSDQLSLTPQQANKIDSSRADKMVRGILHREKNIKERTVAVNMLRNQGLLTTPDADARLFQRFLREEKETNSNLGRQMGKMLGLGGNVQSMGLAGGAAAVAGIALSVVKQIGESTLSRRALEFELRTDRALMERATIGGAGRTARQELFSVEAEERRRATNPAFFRVMEDFVREQTGLNAALRLYKEELKASADALDKSYEAQFAAESRVIASKGGKRGAPLDILREEQLQEMHLFRKQWSKEWAESGENPQVWTAKQMEYRQLEEAQANELQYAKSVREAQLSQMEGQNTATYMQLLSNRARLKGDSISVMRYDYAQQKLLLDKEMELRIAAAPADEKQLLHQMWDTRGGVLETEARIAGRSLAMAPALVMRGGEGMAAFKPPMTGDSGYFWQSVIDLLKSIDTKMTPTDDAADGSNVFYPTGAFVTGSPRNTLSAD